MNNKTSSDYNLFKYSKINENFLGRLIKSELYFASPEKLNDPFDCQINLESAINRAYAQCQDRKRKIFLYKLQQHKLSNEIKSTIETFGICSFSRDLEVPLMWSHYTDEHRGVCCCYEFPVKGYFTNEFIGVDVITYQQNRVTDWLANSDKLIQVIDKKSVINLSVEISKVLLTTKSNDWQYEKESRIIRAESGPLKIPKHFLKKVVFGLLTPEKDIETVKKILLTQYEDVSLFKADRDTSSDIGIKFNTLA